MREFGAELGKLLKRAWEKTAPLAELELHAREELSRGRSVFTLEVDASSFPEIGPDEYKRITYEVEEHLTSALPVKCTEIRHAGAEGKFVLTFERIERSEPTNPQP